MSVSVITGVPEFGFWRLLIQSEFLPWESADGGGGFTGALPHLTPVKCLRLNPACSPQASFSLLNTSALCLRLMAATESKNISPLTLGLSPYYLFALTLWSGQKEGQKHGTVSVCLTPHKQFIKMNKAGSRFLNNSSTRCKYSSLSYQLSIYVFTCYLVTDSKMIAIFY